ncbi:hypothetical protein RCL1_007410 [Eukaryota sp. TZLM3-RCL]
MLQHKYQTCQIGNDATNLKPITFCFKHLLQMATARSAPRNNPPQRRGGKPIKTNLVHPTRPDTAARDQQLSSVDAEITELHQRQSSLSQRLKSLPSSKQLTALFGEKKRLQSEFHACLDEFKAKMDPLLAERASLTSQKSQLQTDINALPVKSVEQAKTSLQETNYRLSTESLNKDQRRKLMDLLEKYQAAEYKLPALQESLNQVNERLSAVKQEIEEVEKIKTDIAVKKSSVKAVNDQIDGLLKARDQGNVEAVEIKTELDQVSSQIDELKKKKKEIRDDFNKQFDEYGKLMEEFRAARAIEIEQQKKEYEAIRAQRKREAYVADAKRKLDDPPFYNELRSCELLISYLEGLVPKTTSEGEVQAQESTEGQVPVKFSHYTSKSKSSKKKSAPAPPKFNLDIDSLGYFSDLKIAAPVTVEEVPAAIEAVKTKKAEMMEQIPIVKQQRQEEYEALLKKFEEELALEGVEKKQETVEEELEEGEIRE